MDIQKMPKTANVMVCDMCDFKCCKQSNFNKHLLTSKHAANVAKTKKNIYISNKMPEMPQTPEMFTCNCGKGYKYYSGLWKHKSKNICVIEVKPAIENEGKNMIDLLISENKDFKNIILELVKNNGDLQKQMMEVCKKTSNTVIANNNNKTFNLQFFLNEQCKDAMNLTDFVDSMTLEFSDLEDVGKLGYVEGISKIMIRKLNELDIYKRPIHCSDAKREIMYVKEHNVWEKEKNSNEHIRKAIKRVTHKNGGLLVPWSLENPNCMNLDHHLNDVYLRMMGQSMGGSGEFVDNENKIMKKIAKAVFIDK